MAVQDEKTATISPEAFAAEARTFLDRHARSRPVSAIEWGVGPDSINVIDEPDAELEKANLARLKEWRRTLFDAGLGWIDGPVEYGGRGLPPSYETLYRDIEVDYDVPDASILAAGTVIIGPTLRRFGSEELKKRYLPGIYRGDIVCCQLFSEPSGGSDLGNIRTRARRNDSGDGWIVNGSKIWTSNARHSDMAELFARTGTQESRHKGITVFMLDMHAPGVEVRPIRQMTGGSSYNQVFLTDVYIPDSHRLSAVDGGWAVVLDSLQHERSSIGLGTTSPTLDPVIERLRQLIVRMGVDGDPVTRQRFARIAMDQKALRLTTQRYVEMMEAGQPLGSEVSLTKIMFGEILRQIAELAAAVLGPRLAADDGEWGTYAWANVLLGAPAMKIGGGTDEILRNTLGEQVLGLPRDRR